MYHINPATNRPNICRSEPGKCSVATKAKHYETAEAAKEKIALQKTKTAPKSKVVEKPSVPSDVEVLEAPAQETIQEPTSAELPEKQETPTVKKDIIEELMEDSLRDKTEDELRPKRPSGFFDSVSENGAALAKKAAQEAEELKESVVALPKNPKVIETTEKLKNAAADGLSKVETFRKSSFDKLKGVFGKGKK